VTAWVQSHEKQMEPIWATLAVYAAAFVVHAWGPWLWVLAPFIGASLTGAAVRRWADRRQELAYGIACGSMATLWSTVAWAAGPDHAVLAVALVVGGVAAEVPWAWHRRARGRVSAARPVERAPAGAAPAPAAERSVGRSLLGRVLAIADQAGATRELRQVVEQWEAITAPVPALKDVDLISAVATGADCWELRLRLPVGRTVSDVVGALERLEGALDRHCNVDVRPGAARVEADRKRASRCLVRVRLVDPLAVATPWPGPTSTSVLQPRTLGRFEDGEPVLLELPGQHVLASGVTGSGKSGFVNVLLAELAACEDVELWGIDLAGGVELSPWAPRLGRLATTTDEALDLLKAALRVVDGRPRAMAGKMRVWPVGRPDPRNPLVGPMLLILVDEAAQLTDPCLKVLTRIAQLGRKARVGVLVATQLPSAASLNGTDLRGQLTTTICLRLREPRHVAMVLGDGMLAAGWSANRLTEPGQFLIHSPKHGTPRPARAYWLSDHAVEDAVRRFGARPGLDTLSAAAAEAPARGTHLDLEDDVPEPDDDTEQDFGGATESDVAILSVLRAAPGRRLSTGALHDETGVSRATLHRRLTAMALSGAVVKLGHGLWGVEGGEGA